MSRLLVVVAIGAVLALFATPGAHAADQWRTYQTGPNTYTEGTTDDGTRWRSRSWRDGPNTYTETQRSDGSKTRCRSYRYGPNTYTTCD